MLDQTVLPESLRMYAEDPASYSCCVDGELQWFSRDQLVIGTQVDSDKIYALYTKYYGSDDDDSWQRTRLLMLMRYHEEIVVLGFIGQSDGHVKALLWRNWKLRVISVHPVKGVNDRKSYLFAPNTPEGKAVLLELKLILG